MSNSQFLSASRLRFVIISNKLELEMFSAGARNVSLMYVTPQGKSYYCPTVVYLILRSLRWVLANS